MQADPTHTDDFPTSFHRWLFNLADDEPRWSILIESSGTPPTPADLTALCRQLNLCHDDGSTRWLAFGQLELSALAAHPASRSLLGVEACGKCPPSGPCGRRKIIRALADRGDAILCDPHAKEALKEHTRILHLRFERDAGWVSLNASQPLAPAKFPTLLAHLVSDWLDASESATRDESAQSPAIPAELDALTSPNILSFPPAGHS